MAINGVHNVLYTSEPDALRATLRDVFGFKTVDAGEGWLIFALPPAEAGVHPAEASGQELYFLCDDLPGTVADLKGKGIEFDGEPANQGWGVTITMKLPGLDVTLYEPRHPTAI
jgi:hypothetical protein